MAKKKVNREYIIKEALNLFRDQGYHKTSMSHIGDACGLLKGSIYHYFAGKEELMMACIRYLHNYYRENAFRYVYDDKLGARQKLSLLAKFHEDLFFSTEGGCLMANIAMETGNVVPEFSNLIRDFFEEWIQAMTHIFKEHYDLEKARRFAKESVYEVEGATMMMRIFADKAYLKRAHDRIIEKFEGAPKEEVIK